MPVSLTMKIYHVFILFVKYQCLNKSIPKLDMVVQNYNLSTQEAEAKGL